MIKYKIETKKGNKGIVEGETQCLVTEAARHFCKERSEGWPGAVTVWEQIKEKQTEEKQKGGRK